jgi:hypothetical protein
LSVSGSGSVEDHEMDLETCGVDDKWYDEESDDSCDPVLDICPLEVSLPSPSLIAARKKDSRGAWRDHQTFPINPQQCIHQPWPWQTSQPT